MYKKLLAGGLTLVMAFGLVACGNSEEQETKYAQETVTTGEDATAGKYPVVDDEIEVEYGVIKLADIADVIVYEDDIKVTEEAYQSQVDSILSSYATTETVEEGEVKEDSAVVVDYSGEIKVDGEKIVFDGGTATDQTINVGTDGANYIDGFVSCLVGKKVGETFTEKLKFPKGYGGTTTVGEETIELAGKAVWFTYTVKSLQVTNTPELNDDFVKEHFGAYASTVDEFKDYAYKQMRIANVVNSNWADFVGSCEAVSYSTELKNEMIKKSNENSEQQISSSYGVSLDQYLEACSMSQEDWDAQIEESVLSDMKTRMIVQAVAKIGGFELTDKVYEEEAAVLAESMTATVEDLETQYGKGEVEYAILSQKVQEYFSENVTVKEGTAPTEAPAETEAEAE